ncbi:hypothetical protein OAG71_01560 [bacterium]|nr:hypothetical protein [bacterium]
MSRFKEASYVSQMLGFVILASCVLVFSGCPGKQATNEIRTTARGVVKLDGEPLKGGGSIKFQSVENSRIRVSVTFDAEGSFGVGDAPKGPIQIAVTTAPELYPEQVPIPKRYANLATSGLDTTIPLGDEPFEINLKSKP